MFLRDLRHAVRSLANAKGLALTVVVTLALGIGANAAIFSVVRGVLLKPLVNRDEDRLIYVRQSARGIGTDNATFSVPEIQDLKAGVKTLSEFGDFSTIGFTMIGLGEPREVRAGVVGGSYFQVMGLHPVLGRLLGPTDDGPNAAGAMVLTYRFWATVLKRDPSVLGKTVRLDSRSATVVGVLEPSIPYPAETEIIANVVTSPHHLSATMVQGRVHRMTELFGRLAPGVNIDQARAELRTAYGAMVKQHPEAYGKQADFQIEARLLREQITSNARTVLLVLLAASGLVFIIAVSNVANLILARTVRREGELAIRTALGATAGALRRTLLAESLLLSVAGAALGILSAGPMVSILARYASRFSVRAVDLTVDPSVLWIGAGLAVIAAVLLAFVPRLPSSDATQGLGLASGSVRITGSTSRRLRVFAVIQIAASFLLLAGASVLLKTLLALQTVHTGVDTQHVLAINVPAAIAECQGKGKCTGYGHTPDEMLAFYKDTMQRITAMPGVDHAAFGIAVPWRDTNFSSIMLQFSGDGHVKGPGEEDPRAQFRTVSPGYFATLGVPIVAGRDFNELDRRDGEQVVMVSQTLAHKMFPNGDALNHHLWWTDPVIKFIDVNDKPRRIIGIVADFDDQHVLPGPTMAVYNSFQQEQLWGGRIFVHARINPYTLVAPITQMIRDRDADQPVEHAATLEDVRAEVLTPDRLNTVVFGSFAAVALAIAIVGVAGVLAFSVSGRTREFGIRLALGAEPNKILSSVLLEGAIIAVIGVAAGVAVGYALSRLIGSYVAEMRSPDALPLVGASIVILAAAVSASLLPAARAARVDAIQALRTE
jgi:putative ABC transport system permease protein